MVQNLPKSILVMVLAMATFCLAQNTPLEVQKPLSINNNGERLKVAVYYETLCGDSKRFIKSQLYPVKQSSLGVNFDVELVPYGKASTTAKGSSYSFVCQHGQAECDGNKMHACALKYINTTELQLDFIYCSMSSQNPPQSLSDCAAKLQIDDKPISTCALGNEGSDLLAKNGEQTHALRPKLYFVPWITFNGNFTEENLNGSQYDFKRVVCEQLRGIGKCSDSRINHGRALSSSSADKRIMPVSIFMMGMGLFIMNFYFDTFFTLR